MHGCECIYQIKCVAMWICKCVRVWVSACVVYAPISWSLRPTGRLLGFIWPPSSQFSHSYQVQHVSVSRHAVVENLIRTRSLILWNEANKFIMKPLWKCCIYMGDWESSWESERRISSKLVDCLSFRMFYIWFYYPAAESERWPVVIKLPLICIKFICNSADVTIWAVA